MILQTGMRTDIPAFFSRWLMNRIREGRVMVRNPFNYHQVTSYRIDPEVVDVLCFCTKNPHPLLAYHEELSRFGQYWFVTITPYGPDLEPGVPPILSVVRSTLQLSSLLGPGALALRYDPVLLSDVYTETVHYRSFDSILRCFRGRVDTVVVSFIREYPKHEITFPRLRSVPLETRRRMIVNFNRIAAGHGMLLKLCGEDPKYFADLGVHIGGCLTYEVFERALGVRLRRENYPRVRECDCLMGHDIGAYNTCLHMCRYCYANYLESRVRAAVKQHDVNSPLLVGQLEEGDRITCAVQKSLIVRQNDLFGPGNGKDGAG